MQKGVFYCPCGFKTISKAEMDDHLTDFPEGCSV